MSTNYEPGNSSQGAYPYPPDNYAPANPPMRRRRGRLLPGCLAILILVILIIVGGWFFVGRAYAHNLAQTQIDLVLSNAVDQVPAQAALLPAGTILPITQDSINNFIVLNSAPADVVQHMMVQLMPNGMQVTFTVYGFNCTMTGVPQVRNGELTLTNVNVTGLIQLIMSPDEVAATMDKYLSQGLAKIHHTVKSVQLKAGEMDLTLG